VPPPNTTGLTNNRYSSIRSWVTSVGGESGAARPKGSPPVLRGSEPAPQPRMPLPVWRCLHCIERGGEHHLRERPATARRTHRFWSPTAACPHRVRGRIGVRPARAPARCGKAISSSSGAAQSMEPSGPAMNRVQRHTHRINHWPRHRSSSVAAMRWSRSRASSSPSVM
jgi:hypothetical protein